MDETAAHLAAAIERGLAAATQALGDAWAAEARAQAPEGLTGHLRASIRFVRTSPTEGYLSLPAYGDVVASGVPGTTTRGGAGQSISLAALKETKAAEAARARYARRVGHTPQHPDPFYLTAWQSRAVQEVLTRVGAEVVIGD